MTIHENASVTKWIVRDESREPAMSTYRRFKQCYWCGQTCSRWADRCHRCWRWF